MEEHPLQDQISRLWPLIKKQNVALKQGFWLEAIALGYQLIEVQLRILLSSKAGNGSAPIEQISDQRFLFNLAELAHKEYNMIDTDLFERICEFNKLRRKGTHYLAIEDVNFDDLEQAARSMFMLGDDIQRKYLTIKVGPVETREEFLVKEEKAST